MKGPIIPGGISCREVVELVTAYLDGALDAEVVQRMDAHLQLCPPCVEYVEQVRTTARLAAAAATAELELRPDRDALLTAFREFKHSD
ncbi:zf-HC2 domain-containing protein [Solirubrobacter soli]|uniref:zf-HC2 domain-containing protein n=1 Tax=Solirubrobacter soli TaxID=363832 RepID=UPI000401185E|nr:zf-HC2 domain-containing protein [Solirubrobacter soli]